MAVRSPIEAASHPDPYPYYARLVAEQPGYYDDGLRCWVISSAAAVSAVLAEPDCRVRPAAEPVPAGMVGTAAGEVFGDLVRMTDGQFHDRVKAVIGDALGQLSTDQVGARPAGGLAPAWPACRPKALDELMFAVPAQVVAGLCGLTRAATSRPRD